MISLFHLKNTIIEIDGPQHFKQTSNWQSPEIQKERDIFKINESLKAGYSIIRILQEDIYYDRNNWNVLLIKELEFHPLIEPDLIMIGENQDFHAHFKLDREYVFVDDINEE